MTWAAPYAAAPLHALITLPGSKSLTNRALVLAALADGVSVLHHPLRSRDTDLMVAGLRALGVAVTDGADGGWHVIGSTEPRHATRSSVDVGNAGTVARFLPALAALGIGDVRFDGDARMRERPLTPLLAALRALGVELDQVAALPVTVSGRGRVRGGQVTVDASSSSQLISGLLLAAPRYDDGVNVRHDGPPLPSAAHLAMTVDELRRCGARVDVGSNTWTVHPGPIRASETEIEPDLSTAAAFLAAPLLAGGQVTVRHWPKDSRQPGRLLPELLAGLGAQIHRETDSLTVAGTGVPKGIDIDLRDAPELMPVMVVLAAFADCPSRITGVAHTRGHESDRLAALATGLTSLGGDIRELPDGLEIRPRTLRGGLLDPRDDHRIAMAWALLGLRVQHTTVANVETSAKTMPGFAEAWQRMLAT